jgi:acetylcholinesterase
MVWIHGGGFFAGSGNPDIYGPDYFMDYDVILVSVNYRVGPLGFFTLENEEVKRTFESFTIFVNF